jgi:hypothetical protein
MLNRSATALQEKFHLSISFPFSFSFFLGIFDFEFSVFVLCSVLAPVCTKPLTEVSSYAVHSKPTISH